PWYNVAVMLIFGCYNNVILLYILSSPRICNKIYCLCCSPNKDKFLTVFYVDKFCNLVSCKFICSSCFFRKLVYCPVYVGIIIKIIIAYSVYYLDWLLCRCRIIKINKWLVFVNLAL